MTAGKESAPGAARAAEEDPLVARARDPGGRHLEEATAFARDCARGALVVNWKGRQLDDGEREEVVQETLARILAGIASPQKTVRSLQDWVKGTVDLVLRERWRQQRRGTPERADPSRPEEPDEALLGSERRAQVWACLDRLPDHYRKMLLLRYEDGLPNRGIAQAMAKTEKAVEQAIPRALRLVRECLERKGVTS
jgi:RNA polymerase sigma-70 factor (ECF subfamily)